MTCPGRYGDERSRRAEGNNETRLHNRNRLMISVRPRLMPLSPPDGDNAFTGGACRNKYAAARGGRVILRLLPFVPSARPPPRRAARRPRRCIRVVRTTRRDAAKTINITRRVGRSRRVRCPRNYFDDDDERAAWRPR